MAENSSLPPVPLRLVRDRSRDKALLVGIQYNNPISDEVTPLHYPHRDMKIFKRYLEEHEGYNADNIVVLMDRENESEDTLPTKANILSKIDGFVKDTLEGDRLIFVFAGHGCQTMNVDGKELDRKDEAILPCDNNGWPLYTGGDSDGKPLHSVLPDGHADQGKLDGIILDDELKKRLIDPLPSGCQLVAFIETCHSGTILDLDCNPQTRQTLVPKVRKRLVTNIRPAAIVAGLSSRLLRPNADKGSDGKPVVDPKRLPMEYNKQRNKPMKVSTQKKEKDNGHATVICFSSAKDDQNSYDNEEGKTMLSIAVDYLLQNQTAVRNVTPQDLEAHICERAKDAKVQSLLRKKLEKKLAVSKKLIQRICSLQRPTVTCFEGDDEVVNKPLKL